MRYEVENKGTVFIRLVIYFVAFRLVTLYLKYDVSDTLYVLVLIFYMLLSMLDIKVKN